MRRLLLLIVMFCTLPAWADNLDDLFTVAGWPQQRAHFNDALSAAQERYRNNLPPAVYQALSTTATSVLRPRQWTSAPKSRCANICLTLIPH